MFKTLQVDRHDADGRNPADLERQDRPLGGVAAACRASLATAGLFSGAIGGTVVFGELNRTTRVIPMSQPIPLESVRASDFEYMLLTQDGQELRIPRWGSLCVPARDDMPEAASLTFEQVVSEWPKCLPEIFAWNPVRTKVADRYYLVLPEVTEQSD
jgi:hypothetical protein